MIFDCGKYQVDLTSPRVMGIVNVTPDSFSDGGQFSNARLAVKHGLKLAEEGADFLDIGGESTRPNAEPVSLQEELDRVIPVIETLVAEANIPISIDTYKPEVMRAAIKVGASLVNDIRALQEDGAVELVAQSDLGVCLMHMQGTPQTMQVSPEYQNVVTEIKLFLLERAAVCKAAGIAKQRIVIDPGFGFGKTKAHNVDLIEQLPLLTELALPVLVGLSRKSVLGQVTGNNVNARLYASIAASVICATKGAKILRVHDVNATIEALKVVDAVMTH